ncbi:MAG: RNA 2',3'-cyclic phosphodiesterase [Opitutales bacterium]
MPRRCFVALDLPDQARDAAREVQRVLREKYTHLRHTSRENLHLTLKFLGEISPELLEKARERLRTVRASLLEVALGAAGSFPPNVLWLRLEGADNLQQQVDAALAPLFEPERRFMGHVTIARTKGIPKPLQRDLEALKPSGRTAKAGSFSLQESRLSHLGPRYETIERYQLQGKGSGGTT